MKVRGLDGYYVFILGCEREGETRVLEISSEAAK